MLNFIKKKKREDEEPIVINEQYGEFTYIRSDGIFNGMINWLGDDVEFNLEADSEGDTYTAKNTLEYFHKIMENDYDWDKRLKQRILENMDGDDERIEIWGEVDESGEYPTIPKREFLRRVTLFSVDVNEDGSLNFDYDLDEMFSDHCMVIEAKITGEIGEAELEG